MLFSKEGHSRSWGINSSGQLGLAHTRTIGDNEHIFFSDAPNLGGVGNPLIARFTYSSYIRASSAINFDASKFLLKGHYF